MSIEHRRAIPFRFREIASSLRFAQLLAMTVAAPLAAQQAVPPSVRNELSVYVGGSPPPAGTMKNPFKGDSVIAAQGAKMFDGFNCSGCHGAAVGAVGPSLADGRWKYGGSDGEIFHSIFYGRQRGMPAFGGALSADAIWRMVTYLQSLQPIKDTLATTSW